MYKRDMHSICRSLISQSGMLILCGKLFDVCTVFRVKLLFDVFLRASFF